MTDHNTTDMQGSIKEQHRQGSLHPADPDMQLPGKGYSQNRIDPAGQSSLSGKQAVSSAQRSLSGKGEPGGIQRIVPFAITFVLGLLVAALIFRTVYAPSSNENEGTAASAGIEEQAAADFLLSLFTTVPKTKQLFTFTPHLFRACMQGKLLKKAIRSEWKAGEVFQVQVGHTRMLKFEMADKDMLLRV